MQTFYFFSFEHNHQTYGQLIFRPLSGSEDLIQFKVVVHRQSIELIISEKNINRSLIMPFCSQMDLFSV